MKIVIGGSMAFAKEQVEAMRILKNRGFEVLATENIEKYVDTPAIKSSFDEELKISLEYDIMRDFFNKIAESDAFLVMNYPKKGIEGYLGASVLMEMGLAYYLKKKIFLLFQVDQEQSYALESAIIDPIVLNGDLNKIN